MSNNNNEQKSKRLLDAMSLADDHFVAEASPARGGAGLRKKRVMTILAASLSAFLLVFNLWLFLPYSLFEDDTPDIDMSGYEDSEYYDLIAMLKTLDADRPKRGSYAINNFELYSGIIFSNGTKGGDSINMSGDFDPSQAPTEDYFYVGGADVPDGSGTGTQRPEYAETTDNQVEGVTEADRIKRTSTHIFYLHDDRLSAYSIEGEDSREVGSIPFSDLSASVVFNEFYLFEDCSTVTLIGRRAYNDLVYKTSILSLDVSDPENMTEKGRLDLSGFYVSSRMVDGSLLLLTSYDTDFGKIDYDDPSTFVPQFDNGEGDTLIPAEDICLPEDPSYTAYTVINVIDEATLENRDTLALFSFTDALYVSENNIYVTKPDRIVDDKVEITLSEIIAVSYSEEELAEKGRVTIEGSVLDQYSLDEHEGILRAVTTTDRIYVGEYTGKKLPDGIGTNASLYCISLEDFSILSYVECFAPMGESVRSARFMGDSAYVCTAIKSTDPVFLFDLSDIENITYKHTGDISGFSTSLIDITEGILLGIGQGDDWRELKLETYTEGAETLDPICRFERTSTYWSNEYKAYFIDREHSLFGLGVTDQNYDNGNSLKSYYYIFEITEDGGIELMRAVNLSGIHDDMRCVFIDGYFYIFGDSFVVTAADTLFDYEAAYIENTRAQK